MITARENILMAYHHEEPYWVPSQYLDQNTCVYTASREGAHGYGCGQVDCFGVSWDFHAWYGRADGYAGNETCRRSDTVEGCASNAKPRGVGTGRRRGS